MSARLKKPEQPCACGCGRLAGYYKTTDSARGIIAGEPKRYVNGHHRRRQDQQYVVDETTGCWVWQHEITTSGYGRLCHEGKRYMAHRWFYEQMVGPIPAHRQLDHLCRNRRCVNPEHLEPVTVRENLMRGETHASANIAKTHCPNGHAYAGSNLYARPDGGRDCCACARVRREAA